MYFVYFLQSLINGKIYVVFTSKDPLERAKENNMGSNKWTKINKLFKLKYYEKYNCKEDAILREKFYKSGFDKQVKYLIIDLLTKKEISLGD